MDFFIGPKAFANPKEPGKTVLHELYRLFNQGTNEIGVDKTKPYTNEADAAAKRLSPCLKKIINMSSDNFKKWIEAGKILELNPHAKIKCPVCGIGTLIVKDEVFEDWSKLDRYMICDNCGKWNVMTMQIPPDYPRSQKSRTYDNSE